MGHELMGSDRNYAAPRARVQWPVRLSALLIASHGLLEEAASKDCDSLLTSPLCVARLLSRS